MAADLSSDNADADQLKPMITQAKDNLKTAGSREAVAAVVADGGYFSDDNANFDTKTELLIAPTSGRNLDSAIADRSTPIEIDHGAERRWQQRLAAAQRRAMRR